MAFSAVVQFRMDVKQCFGLSSAVDFADLVESQLISDLRVFGGAFDCCHSGGVMYAIFFSVPDIGHLCQIPAIKYFKDTCTRYGVDHAVAWFDDDSGKWVVIDPPGGSIWLE